MKYSILIIALLAGCAGTPTANPDDQAAICIRGVTTGRQAATALLRAGKLSVEKHHAMQESFNAAVPGCGLMAEQGAVK